MENLAPPYLIESTDSMIYSIYMFILNSMSVHMYTGFYTEGGGEALGFPPPP